MSAMSRTSAQWVGFFKSGAMNAVAPASQG